MAEAAGLMSWEAFVRTVVARYLEGEQCLNEARTRGEKGEIAEWQKIMRSFDKFLQKAQITIRRS